MWGQRRPLGRGRDRGRPLETLDAITDASTYIETVPAFRLAGRNQVIGLVALCAGKAPAAPVLPPSTSAPALYLGRRHTRRPLSMSYPDVLDPSLVGTYPAVAKAGGGYVWDEVLEYRVWSHSADGSDTYRAFADHAEAASAAEPTGATVLALVLQREYLDEPEPGAYTHVREERVTEWPAVFLRRPRRTDRTIPDFLASDAPADRLDRLRGL